MRKIFACGLLALGLYAVPAIADDYVPPELANMDEAGQEKALRYMMGNMMWTLFHESGHMLVSELELPVLGKEEDAVDSLSTVLLLESKDKELDQALMDTVSSWLALGDAYGPPEDADMMDTHSLNKQRAYSIACLMVGQDQKRFKAFADELELPQERRDECEAEFQQAHDSWFKVIAPYIADDKDKTHFKITYQTTKDKDLAYYRDLLKTMGALELVSDTFNGFVKLKDGIRITGTVCGEANAYWNGGDRELTYCYEDARSYIQSLAEAESSSDDSSATGDDQSTDDSGDGSSDGESDDSGQ